MLERDEHDYQSDHFLVKTSLCSSKLHKEKRTKYFKETVLKKEVDMKMIIETLKDDDWPNTSFIEVARRYGQTQEVRRTRSNFKDIMKMIEKVDVKERYEML